MTRTEVIRYGVERYQNRKIGEETPSIIMTKDGQYVAGRWSEYDYAVSRGWKYDGSIPEEARAMGLL